MNLSRTGSRSTGDPRSGQLCEKPCPWVRPLEKGKFPTPPNGEAGRYIALRWFVAHWCGNSNSHFRHKKLHEQDSHLFPTPKDHSSERLSTKLAATKRRKWTA